MYRVIKASMQDIIAQRGQARRALKKFDPSKVAYMNEMYDDYVSECAKTDDELNFVGNPSSCKRDWLLEAIEEDIMTEEEFNEIFRLLDIVRSEEADAYA